MSYDLTSQPRFGRAGGPTVEQIKGYHGTSSVVSSIVSTFHDNNGVEWLPRPGAGKEFILWGVQAGTSTDAIFGFKVTTASGTGNPDSAAARDLCMALATKQGPFFQSFPQPMRVGEDTGIAIYCLASPGGGATNLAAIFVSLIDRVG